MSDSPPLPRGSYNFNFEDFDENTNPFETKTKMKALDNDPNIDPFKPSRTLSQSPTSSNNNIPDAINSEGDQVNHVEPVRTGGKKIPRSPVQSPDTPNDQQHMQIIDSSPDQSESMSQSAESHSTPEETPTPQSQKKPVIRKGIKKPKFKSKFKPPENFGAQDDEIKIFAPPPSNDANEQGDSTTNETSPPVSHDNGQASSANENSTAISHDSTADSAAPQEIEGVKNKHLLHEQSDIRPEMAQSLEMVHDFEGHDHDMLCGENEGISPAPEVFSDSVGLDIAGDAQINSVYLAGDAHVEQVAKPEGKDENRDEDLTSNGNDSSPMTTAPTKTTSRVPKHPAARVLDGEVEKSDKPKGEEGEDLQYYDAYEYPPQGDSTRVKKNGMKERMESTDTFVQLVQDGERNQVLKYSQSDWNKMKQDLELDFQTRLLNKEREWSKKLADKEKSISHMKDENKILYQSNNDMKVIVTEFEKTIAQLQVETEKTTNESQNNLEDIIKERDQALDDLQGVEMAFSDLHRRYEKTKSVVEGLKKNEEVLKKCIEDYQTKLKKSEEKLQMIKQQAEEKLDLANIEMDKLRRSTSGDMARLEAAMRKSDLQVASLQKSLDQKVKENEELTAICDELISKVGSD